jgi:type II secretory pathway pseudopilin PulG
MRIIKSKKVAGFTLFETILVLGLFSLISLLITAVLATGIRSVKKNQNLVAVKNSVAHTVDLMERQIRSGRNVKCLNNSQRVEFIDPYGQVAYFEYLNYNNQGYNIASGSATSSVALIPPDIEVKSATWSCIADQVTGRLLVNFYLWAQSKLVSGAEAAAVEYNIKILPRNQ